MELRSKNSTITRLLLRAWSASLAVGSACRLNGWTVRTLLGWAWLAREWVISRFSKSKLDIFCGLPSSSNGEIFLLQIGDRFALLVTNHHVHQNQFALDAEPIKTLVVFIALRLLELRLGRRA